MVFLPTLLGSIPKMFIKVCLSCLSKGTGSTRRLFVLTSLLCLMFTGIYISMLVHLVHRYIYISMLVHIVSCTPSTPVMRSARHLCHSSGFCRTHTYMVRFHAGPASTTFCIGCGRAVYTTTSKECLRFSPPCCWKKYDEIPQ